MFTSMWDQKDIVRSAAGQAMGWDAAVLYVRQIGKTFRNRLERAAIVRDLSRLDDRMLADIGLQRGSIRNAAVRTPEESVGGKASLNLGKALYDIFAVPFLLWRERVKTANELYRLSDRELLDIGLARADIDAIVKESVSISSLSTATRRGVDKGDVVIEASKLARLPEATTGIALSANRNLAKNEAAAPRPSAA